jgi:hypothetical protein
MQTDRPSHVRNIKQETGIHAGKKSGFSGGIQWMTIPIPRLCGTWQFQRKGATMATTSNGTTKGANVAPVTHTTEVPITDDPNAQSAIVGADSAESGTDATEGEKSAPSARGRATRAKGGAKAKPAKAKPATARKRGGAVAITMGDLPEKFGAHLADIGKSDGTVFSYRMELKTAAKVLGVGTPPRS